MPDWIRWCKIIFSLVLIGLGQTSYAQFKSTSPFGATNPLPRAIPLEQAFILTVTNQKNTLTAQWQIAPGCYLYQRSLAINLVNPTQSIPLLDITQLPAAENVEDPEFGRQNIYRSFLSIPVSLKTPLANSAQEFTLQIQYQGCNEAAHLCYPPVTQWYKIHTHQNHIQQIHALTTAPLKEKAPTINDSADFMPTVPNLAQKERSLIFNIATFYFLGILLTFTPCVLPMIPILFGVIVGQKHLNTRRAFWLSMCYVLSMAFTYAIAGIIAATLGKNLQAQLQHPVIISAFALLLTYLGLSQVGVVQINLPPAFRMKELLTKLHANQESGTYVGAAVMGLLATLISSPCVTVPLIGALSYISQTGNVLLGGAALLALGLGMGTILLVMGTLGGKFIPKSGAWTYTTNHLFAAMMFAISIWLLNRILQGPWILALWGIWCLFLAWSLGTFHHKASWKGRFGVLFLLYGFLLFWGAASGGKDPLAPFSLNPWQPNVATHSQRQLPFTTISSLNELEEIQKKIQQSHSPLLLVFYADWCSTCQHLEHQVLVGDHLKALLKEWQLVRVDVTENSAQSQALLQHFQLIGPPALLFFDSAGNELGSSRIVGGISQDQLIKHLEKLQATSKR